MGDIEKLLQLVNKFATNISYYKDTKKAYNEHQCRIEYIDPLLNILGWDVSNEKGLAPQYREVIGENYSTQTERPDYTLTLRGVPKMFVEAKKPSVDISKNNSAALQCRKYGWNAKHSITILTNFEYLCIYDTTYTPNEQDNYEFARYRIYHYTDFVDKFEEIYALISRDIVYSGEFEKIALSSFSVEGSQKKQVDLMFLEQINNWRVALSNELYSKEEKYKSLEILSDVVQDFINKIVFLRICEDKNLPIYYKLKETISEPDLLHKKLEELFRSADKKYNSGLFSNEEIVFDLNSEVIIDIIESLYYPQSPYMFNIIEPNLLGKIYELFLTEQLCIDKKNSISLVSKKECINRSIVTTPTEIVKYMVEETLSKVCRDKTPSEILSLKIADIACGSGVFLEEVFSYLQTCCIDWYMENDMAHLIEIGDGRYKLPLEEKKNILVSCIYGIDIDIHAVEVSKFSLLIKLIENETSPTVEGIIPILPDLTKNIFYGNALVSNSDVILAQLSNDDLMSIVPFDWENIIDDEFDVIIGNPPYVKTEDLHSLLSKVEFDIYKKQYKTSYKQFDKYFMFVEQALRKVKANGYVCYIIPNKFLKISAGEKLRELIANMKALVRLDDFGDAQLFEDKTTYSAIVLLQNKKQDKFIYSHIQSHESLWIGDDIESIVLSTDTLNKSPWKLTTDKEFLSWIENLYKKSSPLKKYAKAFNGIQTSAERPTPIYWFSNSEVVEETDEYFTILRYGIEFKIEKLILRPYFKPVTFDEKGLNSYCKLSTDKNIIFPYDDEGELIPMDTLRLKFPGTYGYLMCNYDRLVPKSVSKNGVRDVPNATIDTWYQYGRTQALKVFTNTPKLIIGVLSKEPMYAYDNDDMLISSGGTAGYCAIIKKINSPYELEYIQAWLSHPLTEKLIEVIGSGFEGGYVARGTSILSNLPFVELDFSDKEQKSIHDNVVNLSKEVYSINDKLNENIPQKNIEVLKRKKDTIIHDIEKIIERVYNLEF